MSDPIEAPIKSTNEPDNDFTKISEVTPLQWAFLALMPISVLAAYLVPKKVEFNAIGKVESVQVVDYPRSVVTTPKGMWVVLGFSPRMLNKDAFIKTVRGNNAELCAADRETCYPIVGGNTFN